HRDDHRQPERGLREDRAGPGRSRARADHQPERSGTGDQARDRRRQEGRAVAHRRRHAAAIDGRSRRTGPTYYIVRRARPLDVPCRRALEKTMKRIPIFLFVLIAALSSSAQTPQRPANAAPAGNAEDGKKLFIADGCYQCHGYEAQGSSATGPRLGPPPIALAAFSRYVRQPTGQMPPYTARVLSDAELANIYAFVQSRPEPSRDIPLLKHFRLP